MPLTRHKFIVYADGSCLGNPGPGGWGVVAIAPDGSRREFNGHAAHTTNNQMELTAAIEGLRATEPGSHVVVRSDSQYLVNTMELGWKRAKNQDLWKRLDTERDARTVVFEWVRGHDIDPLNHRADELARMGARGQAIAAASTDGQVIARPVAPEATRTRARAHALESADVRRLRAMLKLGEEVRECRSCGAQFVAARASENYCSQVRCQLESHRT